jgi:hypothetical protein
VEAMTKVGMYKQQQYDQGVQKIQGQIDNIAGMDVAKDSQKQYLQSKLNDLGSRLKTVAAGDFSNNQLVNSVGGMATSIVKDPIVQSSVASTQRLRQEQARAAAARKDGKSSPENDAYFNNETNNWLNDGKLDSSFNAQYTDYVDVNKKLSEIAAKVHEADNSVDIPYQRNADGTLIKDKNGKPLVDEAMLRIKTKGKTAQSLLDNFYDNLDEKDKKQLSITGWYNYRGATKDTFKQSIVSNYNNQKKMLSDNVVDLAVELKTNTNLTATQKAAIQAKINSTNNVIKSGVLDKQMDDEIAGIDSIENLDAYKGQLYTKTHLSKMARDMAYQDKQQEILANPYKQVELKIAEMNQTAQIARQAHLDRMASLDFEKTKFAWTVSEKEKDKDSGSRITPVGLGTDGEAPTIGTLNASINVDQGKIDALNAGAGSVLFHDLNGTERKKALDTLYSQYLTKPASVTNNDQREYVEARRAMEAKIAQKNNLSQSVLKGSEVFDEKIKTVLKGEAPLTFANGKVLYTAQELYDLDRARGTSFYTTRGVDVEGKPIKKFDANAFLNRYKGTKMEPAAIAYVKKERFQPLTSTEQQIINTAFSLGTKYEGVAGDVMRDKLKYQSEQIAKFMPELQVQRGTLNPGASKVDAKAIEDLLTTKYGQYSDLGALDVNRKKDFSPETVSSWRTGKGSSDVKYSLEKNSDGSAKMVIQNGSEKQIVPITAEELGIFFPAATKSSPLSDVKFSILSSTGHTTNSANIRDKESGAVSAYYSGYNIPGLANTKLASRVRMDIEGSQSNDGGAADKYQIRLYALDDNGAWKTQVLNQAGWKNESEIMSMMNQIGTITVEDVLKHK